MALELYYKFDENTGTTANDSSGNARHGTIISSNLWKTDNAIGVSALYFPAWGVVTSPTINATSWKAISVSYWGKTSKVAQCIPFCFGGGWNVSGLYIHQNELTFALPSNSQFVNLSDGTVRYSGHTISSDDRLHHYVLTYDHASKNITYYKDGELIYKGTLTYQIVMPNTPIYIGNYYAGNETYYYNGNIDEFRLYSHVLSSRDVAILYDNPILSTYQESIINSNLLLNYNFETDESPFSYDSTGNSVGTSSNITYDTTNNKSGRKCAVFNGSSSQIATDMDWRRLPINNFTISFWVYVTGTTESTYKAIFSAHENISSVTYGFSVEHSSGTTWQIVLGDGSASWLITYFTMATGQWYHITITKSSVSGVVVYINGQSSATNPTHTGNVVYEASTSKYLYIGNSQTYNTRFFYGYLDDVRMYGTVLSAGNIYSLYAPKYTIDDFGCYYAKLFQENYDVVSNMVLRVTLNGIKTDYSLANRTITDQNNNVAYTTGTGGYQCGVFVAASTTRLLTSPFPRSAGQALTVACWVYHDNNSGYQGIVANRDSGGTSNWCFVFDNGTGKLIMYTTGGTFLISTTAVPTVSWHHIAVTIGTNGIIKFYLDGILDATTGSITYGATTPPNISIGTSANGGGERLDGKLQDVRIYDRELTRSEIGIIIKCLGVSQYYNMNLNNATPKSEKNILGLTVENSYSELGYSTSLLSYWPLSKDLKDYSSYKTHLTSSGTLTFKPSPSPFNDTSVYFDNGATTYATATNPTHLNLTSSISISGWFYFISRAVTVSNGLRKENQFVWVNLNPTNPIYFYVYVGGWKSVGTTFNGSTTANQWKHYVMTYGDGYITVYVDGVYNNSTVQSGSIGTSSNNLYLGGEQGSTQNWYGHIKNVRVYNSVLNASQVKQIYNVEKSSTTISNGSLNFSSKEFLEI